MFDNLFKSANETDYTKARLNIRERGEGLQLDIHHYLYAVAYQFSATGDVRPAVKRVNSLLDDMPKGVRSNAIKAWVEKFLGFAIIEEGDNKGQFHANKAKGANVDTQAAKNARWWEFKPEPEYKGFNLNAEIMRVIAMAEKANKIDDANKREKIDVDQEQLNALRALAVKEAVAEQQGATVQ